MQEVTLQSGATRAVISPDGGYIVQLTDNDSDVLYRGRLLRYPDGSDKWRATHICTPFFGPGGSVSQLPQHGYGRTSQWQIDTRTAASVTLNLSTGQAEYANLSSVMTITISENTLQWTLQLTNNDTQPLRVAPGFHPYFAVNRDQLAATMIDGQPLVLDHLADTVYCGGGNHQLTLPNKTVTIQASDTLQKTALWTDQIGDYLCVEPTVAGYSLVDTAIMPTNEQLLPGKTAIYTIAISWSK